MVSQVCHAAANPNMELSDAVRGRLHRKCPGAYLGGECGCPCHTGGNRPRLSDAEKASLRPGMDTRVFARTASEKAEKRADVDSRGYPDLDGPPTRNQYLAPTAGGHCECGCGAPVARRFKPGHDAKLKSRLRRELESRDQAARQRAADELDRRGWL